MSRKLIFLICFVLIGMYCTSAFSEEYPSRPINLYIGFSAGGSTDLLARAFEGPMASILGQPLVSINKPGGNSTVESALLAQAKPDGFTIGTLNTSALTLIPHQMELPYNPLRDFTPIIQVALHPMGLCVRPDSPWKTLKEFIDYAKNNPDKVTYSTVGAGSPQHIVMEVLAKKEGIRWKHVPYPGGADATTTVIAGHVIATSGAGSIWPVLREGRLRLLVVYGAKRMSAYPNVPTLKESGYDLAMEQGTGFGGPKGIPELISDKLEAAFKKALFDPRVAKVMEGIELPVMYRNRKDFQKYLQDDYKNMEKLMKDLGMYKKGS